MFRAARMQWVACRDRLPVSGQEVWYYGPAVGVWRGHYKIDKSEEGLAMCRKWGVPPHLFICGESIGVVDTDDAPWWMPYESGSDRPSKPEEVSDAPSVSN